MADGRRDRAIADLARERGEALTRYAYLYTGDASTAQDLVQEALVKVYVRMGTGFEPEGLEGYVRRAITTLYIDGYRRRRTWGGVEHLLADPPTAPAGDHGLAERVDLHAALATLGRQERAAIVLRYLEDLTVPEVARRMGLAEGSVKRYLSNATRRLEQRLGPVRAVTDDTTVVLTTTVRRAARS